MNKGILSVAVVLAATSFSPTASALPSFARQTGVACSTCHQQHYPVLKKFGQAFKASGYTMMGAQTKVEGEHLSIPDTLNGAMLLKARYQKTNGTDTIPGTLSGETTNGGQWQIPDEFSLFFGGRVHENIGFMFEGNMNAPAVVAGLKVPFIFDAEPAKLMVIPYLTDALGASYGFELASTGAVRNVRWAEHRSDISAQQYIGTATAATGVAFVALNDMGYINISRWSPNFTAAAGTAAIQLKSNYLRIAATPTVADWNLHIGLQSWSGSNYEYVGSDASVPLGTVGSALEFNPVDTKATAVDFQGQGVVADKDLSVYATYAKAPVSGTNPNLFNAATKEIKAFTVGADYSVIPNTLHLGVAYRNAKNGAATDDGDNSITLTAIYDLTMNVALHVNHSKRSGSHYNTVQPEGTSLTTFLLEAAW